MLSSRKYFVGASMVALVVGFVAAMVCVLALVAVASAGAKRAEALPRPGVQDISGTRTNPLKFVTEESPPPRGPSVTKVEVQCPSQYRAIGGGFDVRYLDTPWFVLASRPSMSFMSPADTLAQGEGWVVKAYNAVVDLPPFRAYAVCAPISALKTPYPVFPVTYPHESRTISIGGKAQLTPPCGPNRKAIGGGFDRGTYGDPFQSQYVRLIRSQPNPGNGFHSWIVAAHNNNHLKRHDLTAFSVCVADESVKNLYHENAADTGTKEVEATTKPCGGDTYLLSGGFGVADRDAADVQWSHSRPGPGSQLDPPLNWSARIKASGKITVHAFAMCGTLGDQQADGKLSGKNPGWGDGMGGGRFKK